MCIHTYTYTHMHMYIKHSGLSLPSEQIISLSTPLKIPQSEGITGDLLHQGQQSPQSECFLGNLLLRGPKARDLPK